MLPDADGAEPPRAKRRRLKAAHVRRDADNYVPEITVVMAPWGDYEFFTTRRKARKFARRHKREIEANFSY